MRTVEAILKMRQVRYNQGAGNGAKAGLENHHSGVNRIDRE
jgi:hypothetical protein